MVPEGIITRRTNSKNYVVRPNDKGEEVVLESSSKKPLQRGDRIHYEVTGSKNGLDFSSEGSYNLINPTPTEEPKPVVEVPQKSPSNGVDLVLIGRTSMELLVLGTDLSKIKRYKPEITGQICGMDFWYISDRGAAFNRLEVYAKLLGTNTDRIVRTNFPTAQDGKSILFFADAVEDHPYRERLEETIRLHLSPS